MFLCVCVLFFNLLFIFSTLNIDYVAVYCLNINIFNAFSKQYRSLLSFIFIFFFSFFIFSVFADFFRFLLIVRPQIDAIQFDDIVVICAAKVMWSTKEGGKKEKENIYSHHKPSAQMTIERYRCKAKWRKRLRGQNNVKYNVIETQTEKKKKTQNNENKTKTETNSLLINLALGASTKWT